MYSFAATVNYPDAKEVDTPDFAKLSRDHLLQTIIRLIDTEPEMTSCVITITKEQR